MSSTHEVANGITDIVEPSPARYIDFKELPVGTLNTRGEPALNRWSHFITKDHDYPASQVYHHVAMLTTLQERI